MTRYLHFESTCHDLSKQTAMKMLCYILVLMLCHCGDGFVNYSKIEKFGNSCPKMDSCVYQRIIHRRQTAQSKERNCACDYLCSEYGDCCFDASLIDSYRNNLKCLQVELIGGVYMRYSCPPSYKGHEYVRRMCEETKVGDQVDPLGSMPITDSFSGITYKNYYCSMCNNISDDIVMWTPKLDCPLLKLLNTSKTITREYVLQNLATDGKGWGLYLNDENDGSRYFHDCNVYAVLSPQIERKIRFCKPNLISDCPHSWKDTEVRDMCRSYMGAKFDHDGYGYRNVHCATCNGVNVTQLSCQSLEDIDIFRGIGLHSFAILLDIDQRSGDQVGLIRKCIKGEVYDPFYNKCRSVMCLPGFAPLGRRCILRNPAIFLRFNALMREMDSKRMSNSSTTENNIDLKRNVTQEINVLISTSEIVTTTFPTA